MSIDKTVHVALVRIVTVKQCWSDEKRHSKIARPDTGIVLLKKKANKFPSRREELCSTIPGLKHVLDSRKGMLFKTLWLLVIGFSAGICFYQINNRLELLISNPIESRLTVLRNKTVKFPSVTVCPLEERHVPLFSRKKLKAAAQKIPICNMTFTDLMPELNISTIWTMMNTDGTINKSVIFARLNLVHEGYVEPFETKSTLTFFGNCTTYKINTMVPFRGEDYKINIQFNEPPKDSCGRWFLSAMYYFHHDDEDVTYKVIIKSSFLRSGTLMIYGVEATEFRVIDRIEAPCDTIAAASLCERQCVEKVLKKRLPCRLPFMNFDDVPLCANSSEAQMVFEDTRRIAIETMYSKPCSCPGRCNEIVYSTDLVISTNCPHPVLEYHFDSNFVVHIQEYYSYTLIPFICDMGGNLGLFLGLCIPTIVEIIQNVVGYLFTKIFSTRAE